MSAVQTVRPLLRAEGATIEGLSRSARRRALGGGASGSCSHSPAVLCADPRIVLLDEPTEGIQPSIIEEIIETLAGITGARGLTVLLVEQNLSFISGLSDRVLILQKGLITPEVPPEVARDRTMIDEFVGMA